MDHHKTSVATACLKAAEDNTMTFPEIVGTLMREGFESYTIDFRSAKAIYYLADGNTIELPLHNIGVSVAPGFDTARIQAAIKEAQQLIPGYTYKSFCNKITAAGCAGYMVSFSGRRALYFGRTAETHVERFPD